MVDRSRTVSLTSSSSLPALFLPLMLEEELASSLPAMLTEMCARNAPAVAATEGCRHTRAWGSRRDPFHLDVEDGTLVESEEVHGGAGAHEERLAKALHHVDRRVDVDDLAGGAVERDDVRGVLHVVAGDGLDARVAEAVQPVGKVTRVPGGDDVVAHVERHGALHVVADDLLVVCGW